MSTLPKNTPMDRRIWMYRQIKRGSIILAALLIVKLFIFDTMHIATAQMQPELKPGDQVLLWKLPFVKYGRSLFLPSHKSVVICKNPVTKNHYCLRVFGRSGDTVQVTDGVLRNTNYPSDTMHRIPAGNFVLPSNYSPRDFCAPFRIPKKGEVIELDSLNLRDFFFATNMIRTENPTTQFNVSVTVFVNGTAIENPPLKNFTLFNKSIREIPDSLAYDFFFWATLEEYLSTVYTDQSVTLTHSLFDGTKKLFRYSLKESYIFLIADDWNAGFDSRYFGPVGVSCIVGKVTMVLWSNTPFQKGLKSIRFDRLGRFIR